MTSTPEAQSRTIFFEGIGHFEARRWDEARACFERCLALTPDRPSVLGNLGITLVRLGRIREAVPLLERATAADAAFAEAWAHLGQAHERAGAWAAAEQALGRALALPETASSAALWFMRGGCLMRLERADDALRALDRALAIDPAFGDAWSRRGGLLRETGRLDDAAASFEQAIAHGADRELNAFYLAAVRAGEAPPLASPRAYVQGLFDDYAADFDRHLVHELGYRGHELLLAPIIESGGRFRCALDLGCGTGLCAPLLAPHCDALDGVDLSAVMLERARERGLYRTLVQTDIGAFLAGSSQRLDLVVAADVMIYVGDLAQVFREVARLLDPGGLFAMTIETPTNADELQLLPSLRYAHAQSYVERLAMDCGLAVKEVVAAPIRSEQGRPVQGRYVYLVRV